VILKIHVETVALQRFHALIAAVRGLVEAMMMNTIDQYRDRAVTRALAACPLIGGWRETSPVPLVAVSVVHLLTEELTRADILIVVEAIAWDQMTISTMMNEKNGTGVHLIVEDIEEGRLTLIITRVAGEPEDVAIIQDTLPNRETLDLQVLLDQEPQTANRSRIIEVSIGVEKVVSDLLFISLMSSGSTARREKTSDEIRLVEYGNNWPAG
jgi:hypothetical protein